MGGSLKIKKGISLRPTNGVQTSIKSFLSGREKNAANSGGGEPRKAASNLLNSLSKGLDACGQSNLVPDDELGDMNSKAPVSILKLPAKSRVRKFSSLGNLPACTSKKADQECAESTSGLEDVEPTPYITRSYLRRKGSRRRYKRRKFAHSSSRITEKPETNLVSSFNHYDDGSGFLDGNALGIDFPSGGGWEGIGCMGLGGNDPD